MSVRNQGAGPERSITYKQPDHPVTKADRLSHEYISLRLKDLTPLIPVISEESDVHMLPDSCRQFWLVDPMDGTKEFIKGSDEFTVNIALVQDGTPVLGIIDVPAFQETYFGGQSIDFSVIRYSQLREIPPALLPSATEAIPPPYVLSLSRSHRNTDDETFLSLIAQEMDIIQDYCGSSLKFCRVAEGRSHFYARMGPTMEWDTAAGHAIVTSAGGRVVDWNLKPLAYGKPGFRNPGLIAMNRRGLGHEEIWKKLARSFHRTDSPA